MFYSRVVDSSTLQYKNGWFTVSVFGHECALEPEDILIEEELRSLDTEANMEVPPQGCARRCGPDSFFMIFRRKFMIFL